MSEQDRFSLDNFKKWMKDHPKSYCIDKSFTTNPLIGVSVESKIGVKKLVDKMVSESEDLESLARDFFHDGGTISDVDGKNVEISVASGKFNIHRAYIRKN
jgi:hypothetical protein